MGAGVMKDLDGREKDLRDCVMKEPNDWNFDQIRYGDLALDPGDRDPNGNC